ncbi:MAG: hypothetical protein K6F53_04810 [Lachnospiraceae bacterium]|nr:hypothetical protein [Lachnospiraceae bacterium]
MKNMRELFEQTGTPESPAEMQERIEQVREEIARMISELKECTPEEKQIMDSILKTLTDHNMKFLFREEVPRRVCLRFGTDNKPFELSIYVQSRKVSYRLCFPFRVQTNALFLVSMYMAEFNADKSFSVLNLDMENGELSMEYSYILQDPETFDEDAFMIYMNSLIHLSMMFYVKLSHLAAGMVPRKDKELYRFLLQQALETIEEKFDDEKVTYGTQDLQPQPSVEQRIFERLFGETDDMDSEEDLPFNNGPARPEIVSLEELQDHQEEEG